MLEQGNIGSPESCRGLCKCCPGRAGSEGGMAAQGRELASQAEQKYVLKREREVAHKASILLTFFLGQRL